MSLKDGIQIVCAIIFFITFQIGQAYIFGRVSVEDAYKELYENSFIRLLADVKRFAKTYNYYVEHILATLKAKWEAVLFYVILDTPEGKPPMIAKRVLNVMAVKLAAYQYKYKLKLDINKVKNKVKEFLLKIGEVATRKFNDFLKYSHERTYKQIFSKN